MSGHALTITIDRPYGTVLSEVRAALSHQGFGVLTEIDIQATMMAKLNVDVAPQMILGACRPPLALAALRAEPSIGLLLPCNVVVRSIVDGTTVVEAADPEMMVSMTANPAMQAIADEATGRLRAALAALDTPVGSG